MENSSVFLEMLIDWFPILLLIAVFTYFMKKSGSSNMSDYLKNQIEEERIRNEKLERIATALEEIKSNLKS